MANTTDPQLKQRPRWFSFAELGQKLVFTPKEKRVAVFVLAAFLLGLGTKQYRAAHPAIAPAPSKSISDKARSKREPAPSKRQSHDPGD